MHHHIGGVILSFVICMALIGCAKAEQPESVSSTVNSNVSSSQNAVDDANRFVNALTSKDTKVLEQYVASFAESFPHSFTSSSELDLEAIGWFAFGQIYQERQDSLDNSNGAYFIQKEDVAEYVNRHFGIEGYVYPGDAPMYNEEKKAYLFYPLGEGSLVTADITKVEQDGQNVVTYSVHLVKSPFVEDAEHQKEEFMVAYTFSPQLIQENYALQAVSAEKLAT